MDIQTLKRLIEHELSLAEHRINDEDQYQRQLILEDLIGHIRVHLAAS